MAKIKVSQLTQLAANNVNEDTSLLAVDNQLSYQLKYGFLSVNLSNNLYIPLTETISAKCDIQQQKDNIAALSATSKSLSTDLSTAILLSTQTLASRINEKIDKTFIATRNDLGLIKVGYDTEYDNKKYAVLIDDNSNAAYVYVPWEGGSGGSDPAVNVLKNISSYYAEGTDSPYTNKVQQISDDVSNISESVTTIQENINIILEDVDELRYDIINLSIYCVGSIYTTTNDVTETIKMLSTLIYEKGSDKDKPSKWEEIATSLPDIHFLKRIE